MEAVILEERPAQGITMINGKAYMPNAKGGFDAIELVKAQHKLQDEVVRKVIGYAEELSAQVARFKQHTFNDLGQFEALLAQEYQVAKGGAKGNKTFMTYDGLKKVTVQVADRIDFGPELQIAKALIDECLNEWSVDSTPEIRTVVTRAFKTEKEGQINRAEVFMLLQLDIKDERWQRAMAAIKDAIRVVGSKIYVRCYQRPTPDAEWQAITIDLAKA